jgi:hypothetical protein
VYAPSVPVIDRGCAVCFCVDRDRPAEHALLTLLLMVASGRSYGSIYRNLCFTHRRTIDRGLKMAQQDTRTIVVEPGCFQNVSGSDEDELG